VFGGEETQPFFLFRIKVFGGEETQPFFLFRIKVFGGEEEDIFNIKFYIINRSPNYLI